MLHKFLLNVKRKIAKFMIKPNEASYSVGELFFDAFKIIKLKSMEYSMKISGALLKPYIRIIVRA
jgi:hypothetical protein